MLVVTISAEPCTVPDSTSMVLDATVLVWATHRSGSMVDVTMSVWSLTDPDRTSSVVHSTISVWPLTEPDCTRTVLDAMDTLVCPLTEPDCTGTMPDTTPSIWFLTEPDSTRLLNAAVSSKSRVSMKRTTEPDSSTASPDLLSSPTRECPDEGPNPPALTHQCSLITRASNTGWDLVCPLYLDLSEHMFQQPQREPLCALHEYWHLIPFIFGDYTIISCFCLWLNRDNIWIG